MYSLIDMRERFLVEVLSEDLSAKPAKDLSPLQDFCTRPNSEISSLFTD
jgi:hypothetical protein